MNLFDLLTDEARQEAPLQRMYGVVVGIVTNNKDKEGLGRVKVSFPWLGAQIESHWARVATPMAGKDRGIYFLPEVEDEVLVAFEQGDLRFPYVIGALWNGKDAPPAQNDDGKNNVRMIKSRSGHVIRLNDEDGKEKIEIMDKTGKNRLVLDTAANTLTVQTEKDILLSAEKGTIKLDAKNVEIKASEKASLKTGSGDLDIEAGKQLILKGKPVNIN